MVLLGRGRNGAGDRTMIEIVYQYDPKFSRPVPPPATPAEARKRLCDGNRDFVAMFGDLSSSRDSRQVVTFDLADLGVNQVKGSAPRQRPFAVVMGCSDARAPTELIFHQASNALFVVRVAGNVLGNECLGSVEYAVRNLGTDLKLLVVMGHSGCGAVTAAVDAFLDPSRYLTVASSQALRAIVDRIVVPVRAAADSLERVRGLRVTKSPGYRRALIESAVVLNSAITARTLKHEFREVPIENIDVVYGVYDLVTRAVNLPDGVGTKSGPALFNPPTSDSGFEELSEKLANSAAMTRMLDDEGLE